MANVFSKQTDVVNKPRRNVFDLSHGNNVTLKFGALTPCYVEEVVPGDSFQIETRMALKLMPMIFPVQTDMRAYVHFFYVRNRNLWKDWQNFIGMLPQGYTEQQMQKYEVPYIDFNGKVAKTGTIYDYMGLPTTRVGRFGSEHDLTYNINFSYWKGDVTEASERCLALPYAKTTFANINAILSGDLPDGLPISSYIDSDVMDDFNKVNPNSHNYEYSYLSDCLWSISNYLQFFEEEVVTENVNGIPCVKVSFFMYPPFAETQNFVTDMCIAGIDINNNVVFGASLKKVMSEPYIYVPLSSAVNIRRFVIFYTSTKFKRPTGKNYFVLSQASTETGDQVDLTPVFLRLDFALSGTSFVSDLNDATQPYYKSTDASSKKLKISALPFRAYESVYNAFYRDPRNNPYLLNGSPEYNKWCPSVEGGADANDYPLHYRNWEADFLTTALPSPQQGEAPLVGITNSGKLAFIDETGTTYRADLEFNEDNSGLKGINVQASDEPVGTMTRIVDFATSGISIADLRGVNALQRWLEINARRGYRYKDQIKSHFDVDIRFDELDMPEFLGGTSAEIYVNQISQTVNQSDSGSWQDTLGAYGGQGFTRVESSRPIRHYFDEHGYIIGVISVVPVPCYSQLLPKHFLKRSPLDFYFPEFGKLGMQPITYNEVCPIQTYNSSDGVDGMQDTFGYQRAWYEYLARVDEVHGEFRLSMRNFLINRVFNERPELSEDFLTVNPEQINQVFAVTQMTDKIFGQLYFKVTAKRPIPEYGIPALE